MVLRLGGVELRMTGDGLSVEDLGSRNGTYLNERRIDGPQQLRNNDLIHIGSSTVLKFIDSVEYFLANAQAPLLAGGQTLDALEHGPVQQVFADRHRP